MGATSMQQRPVQTGKLIGEKKDEGSKSWSVEENKLINKVAADLLPALVQARYRQYENPIELIRVCSEHAIEGAELFVEQLRKEKHFYG